MDSDHTIFKIPLQDGHDKGKSSSLGNNNNANYATIKHDYNTIILNERPFDDRIATITINKPKSNCVVTTYKAKITILGPSANPQPKGQYNLLE